MRITHCVILTFPQIAANRMIILLDHLQLVCFANDKICYEEKISKFLFKIK